MRVLVLIVLQVVCVLLLVVSVSGGGLRCSVVVVFLLRFGVLFMGIF